MVSPKTPLLTHYYRRQGLMTVRSKKNVRNLWEVWWSRRPGITDFLGMFQRPLTLILPQKYHDTNGRRSVTQSGGLYATFCPKEGILLQKYRDRNGRRIAKCFKNVGVRGRFGSPCIHLQPRFRGVFSDF